MPMPKAYSLPVLPPDEPWRLAPTDLSLFVRLEQCERFLRLRLAERAGHPFMAECGVAVQRVAPLMSLSGRRFEDKVEQALRGRFRSVHFAEQSGFSHARSPNNAEVLAQTRGLKPGEVVLLFQTRLEVTLGNWLLRGDVDLIKLSRSAAGALDVLIIDLKSTAQVKVEHRLQVAFYYLMLKTLFDADGVAVATQRTGVLFRPPVAPTPEEEAAVTPLRDAARAEFGLEDFLLELVADQDAYLRSAHDLLVGPDSTARRIGTRNLDELPYCLSFKCDDCLYTEFCMKDSVQREDLSLLPYLSGPEKEALRRSGITTIEALATLKDFAPPVNGKLSNDLVPAPGREAQVRQLASTWPVGPRLDELIHRAKRFRQSAKKDGTRALWYIPDQGNSSLPQTQANRNANLVWLYLDAQHDPLEGRIYLLGALVVACQDGQPVERRAVIRMTDGPPDSAKERQLFVDWTRDLLEAVVTIARSDAKPKKRAPIHVVFFDRYEQRLLLEGLARNFPAMLEQTPPLYDFLTQIAPYDSPIASYLNDEVRTFQNYPMTCQSLQSLATFLKFDWNMPHRFRELFRARLFDYLGRLDSDGESEWYTRRARFSSMIPAEYAYAAWNQLPQPRPGQGDEFADFRPVTRDLLMAFQKRRLEAMEHVASNIRGNPHMTKTAFTLPEIAGYEDKARDLAGALDEFVRIERLVSLADWKSLRHAPPEQRALMGECLIVRYREADQEPANAERNRENQRRQRKREEFEAAHPGKNIKYPDDCQWSPDGLRLKLRVETTGMDCDLNELLLLSTLRDEQTVVLYPRWTVDGRSSANQRQPHTPTPKQLLYGQRAELRQIIVSQQDENGRISEAFVEVELKVSYGNHHTAPYVFSDSNKRPLVDGELYTLDPCPNQWYGYWCFKVVEGLCEGKPNALYDRLVTPPESGDGRGSAGQQAFLTGLHEFHQKYPDLMHGFEPSKRELIGGHATTPILMVQGPPGTGKSYSTAFAVFARLQGAMRAAKRDGAYRVFLSCKTHAATDVLLKNMLDVQQKLRALQQKDRQLFKVYFEERLLEVPLFRVAPNDQMPEGIITLVKDTEKGEDAQCNADVILNHRWAIVGITPGGTYSMLKKYGSNNVFGHELCDLLVLDEASQMNLPEALLAALPLKPDAPVVVVGDHRQMPPIVQHDWDNEARRTFQQYQVYHSLFDTLRQRTPPPPMIRFAESFRLHQTMAAFLREEVYRHDGIDYHSRKTAVLPRHPHDDDFVAAVLDPDYPLVVVVHDEASSQVRNPFEQNLIGPILRALADPSKYGLDPAKGLGVVVPHRAQRAALQQAFPELSVIDLATGLPARSAVDTVERFQGDERTVVMVSATESDRGYLLASAGFLLDPRRLTVAISRAKQKMILVASRSIFTLFSPDEQTFANARLWKNLLTRTCTNRLWAGERDGVPVAVWGGR
jgi:hypothetical protein